MGITFSYIPIINNL